MMDLLKIGVGVLTTLAASSIIWLVRTISKSKSDIDIAFLKIRYLEEQVKDLKDELQKYTERRHSR